jgi:hypothetical protein
MIDYKRFDAIDTDSEDESRDDSKTLKPTIVSNKPPQIMAKKGKEGRIKFEHDGKTIYEWEQSLTEVNIYITAPINVAARLLDIKITHRHLIVGIKHTQPFIDEDTGGPVKPDESMWTLIDGEININLQKMNKAEAWDCALVGRAGAVVDSFTKEEIKKKLMLERFQEEVSFNKLTLSFSYLIKTSK